ncbi:hypothetical protein [Flagellimonas eckloniae]|uniref:Uncharacterized protein n=1 Tax=Flagellimonas eckloniae TaxID=346185 RepID=A0A0Q0XMK0_9FLAO|nr:hypothetical protein [Allomuricauda eckloniae]KQC30245.1 hypothetical protein AAY42_10435 [Allomuricauda eckloniae]
MRTTLFTFFLGLTLFNSCITINKDPENENKPYYEEEERYLDEEYDIINENEPFEEPNFENEEGFDEEIHQHNPKKNGFFDDFGERGMKIHEFRDARTGLVVNSTEYPVSWKVISKPTYIIDQKLPVFLIQTTGPNNLKSFNTPMKVHISYQNPQTYQFMQNSSVARLHRSMVSNQQILKEEVATRMQKTGFKFVKNIRLYKTENYLKGKIRTESNGQVQVDLLATVWENNKGQKALVSVGKIYMQQPLSFIDTMTMWMYSTDYTFIDAGHFDETIAAFENALINSKENPKWKQYVAQLSQQRTQIAAQKARTGRINRERAFAAHQRKMKGIWAAQDANHTSFMNRNFGSGSSTSQRDFVNMINEEETVYNPLDGKNYQVNAFSTQNWMDSDGNLIQNDDLFYTPNGDINLNNREWVNVNGN